MKVTVRQGVFETNSSSTHTLTIVSKDLFKLWKDVRVLYEPEHDLWIPEEGEELSQDILDEIYNFWAKLRGVNLPPAELCTQATEEYLKITNELQGNEWTKLYFDNYSLKYHFYSYAQFIEEYARRLDRYEKEYRTRLGDDIVIFGIYGFDG